MGGSRKLVCHVACGLKFLQSNGIMKSKFNNPYLISCEELLGQLEDPELRIFDCTQQLVADPKVFVRAESCFQEYLEAHIPGADYIDIKSDLSDASTRWRYMMPEPENLIAAFARYGIGKGTRVVLYDSGSMMWAARVWWLLRNIRFDDAVILDGGLQRWRITGKTFCNKLCKYEEAEPINFDKTRELLVDHSAVLRVLKRQDTVVVNALTREQFTGGGIHYGRPGRISGSVCVPARELTDKETGLLKRPEELGRLFAGAGVDLIKPIICYCGGGIAATLDAFVLILLGRQLNSHTFVLIL